MPTYPGGPAARVIETLIAFSQTKDANITTATAAAGTSAFRMSKLNVDLMDYELTAEDDAAEIGKGDEFATAVFPVSNQMRGRVEKYLSSEIMGWAIAFGFGSSVASVSGGGTKHLASPFNPVTLGLELPYLTVVEQIRPGSTPVVDRSLFGTAIDGFQIDFTSSPARDSAKIVVDLIGTGSKTEPSGVTMPAVTSPHELKASSLILAGTMLQVSATDYVTAKTFVSCTIGYKNNLTARYAPGGGTQAGGALATALEVGTRAATFSAIVRLVNGSDEFQKITNSTTGPAQLDFTGPSPHAGNVTFAKLGWKAAKIDNTNGIVTLRLDASILNPGSGIMSAFAVNSIAKQGAEP